MGNAIDDLKLISPARKIHIVGPLGVGIVSRFGDIQLMGLKDLRFKAKQGKVCLSFSKTKLMCNAFDSFFLSFSFTHLFIRR